MGLLIGDIPKADRNSRTTVEDVHVFKQDHQQEQRVSRRVLRPALRQRPVKQSETDYTHDQRRNDRPFNHQPVKYLASSGGRGFRRSTSLSPGSKASATSWMPLVTRFNQSS